jgi:hypothetical protein
VDGVSREISEGDVKKLEHLMRVLSKPEIGTLFALSRASPGKQRVATMAMQTDPQVLNYILTVFPPELELLAQLGETLRARNIAEINPNPVDVEPVLVTEMWMRRVLEHAQDGELDVKGIFELSACLANEMPKLHAEREAELRKIQLIEIPANLEMRDFGEAG